MSTSWTDRTGTSTTWNDRTPPSTTWDEIREADSGTPIGLLLLLTRPEGQNIVKTPWVNRIKP